MKAWPKLRSRQVDELQGSALAAIGGTQSSIIRFLIPDGRSLFATIDGLRRGWALPRAVAIRTKRIMMRPGSFYDISH
jgi:hypothetical protein